MRAFAISLLFLGCSCWAAAQPITYTIAGIASAAVDPNSNLTFPVAIEAQPFQIQASGDTGDIDPFLGLFLPAGASTITIDGFAGSFTESAGLANDVDFYVVNPINVVIRLSGAALTNYDLSRSIGPVNVSAQLNPNSRLPGLLLSTTFGGLRFDAVSDVTFAATTTPEPATVPMLLLSGLVLGVPALLRRRRN